MSDQPTITDGAVDAYDRAHGNYEGDETSTCRREAAAIRAGLAAAAPHIAAQALRDAASQLHPSAGDERARQLVGWLNLRADDLESGR